MLNCLEQVKLGLLRPQIFQTAEMTRRTLNFTLSSTSIIEPCFTAAVFSLDIDSTGRYLLSGGSDGAWYIHDTFNLTREIDHVKPCVGRCPRQLGHKKSIWTAEWYLDNGLFITSSSDGKVKLWDANNTAKGAVDEYTFDGGFITRHQINPCSGTVIAVCVDGEVCLIDIRAGTAIQKIPDTLTNSKEVRWNPGNEYQLLVGSEEGHIIEWDVRSTLSYRGYGLLEVKVARRGVRTRDFKEQVSLLQKAHDRGISSIRFSTDGNEFYSMGNDGRIRRWLSGTNPMTEPLVSTLKYGRMPKGPTHFQIGISDTDPPLIFTPNGNSIAVCDMKTCKVQRELRGHIKSANCFVYDPKYQQGYSGGSDSSVMLWTGNLTTEQAYHLEKDKSGRRLPRANKNGQLVHLIEDEDAYMEEYEVVSSDSEG